MIFRYESFASRESRFQAILNVFLTDVSFFARLATENDLKKDPSELLYYRMTFRYGSFASCEFRFQLVLALFLTAVCFFARPATENDLKNDSKAVML